MSRRPPIAPQPAPREVCEAATAKARSPLLVANHCRTSLSATIVGHFEKRLDTEVTLSGHRLLKAMLSISGAALGNEAASRVRMATAYIQVYAIDAAYAIFSYSRRADLIFCTGMRHVFFTTNDEAAKEFPNGWLVTHATNVTAMTERRWVKMSETHIEIEREKLKQQDAGGEDKDLW